MRFISIINMTYSMFRSMLKVALEFITCWKCEFSWSIKISLYPVTRILFSGQIISLSSHTMFVIIRPKSFISISIDIVVSSIAMFKTFFNFPFITISLIEYVNTFTIWSLIKNTSVVLVLIDVVNECSATIILLVNGSH